MTNSSSEAHSPVGMPRDLGLVPLAPAGTLVGDLNLSPQTRPDRCRSEPGRLNLLEVASLTEAATLLLLVFVAMPLKHLASLPKIVEVMGPLHGIAFAFYAWTLIEAVAAGGWSRSDVVRLALAALVPFGGFANLGWLHRRLHGHHGEVL